MAMFDIMKGKRPRRPPHPDLTDGVWRLMERCWDQEPRSRPQMSDVLQVLRNLSVSLSSLRSATGCLTLYDQGPSVLFIS